MRTAIRRGAAAASAVVLSVLGLTTGAQAAPAEADVVSVAGAEVVPDSYVVVLKSGRIARTVAAEHDATVLHTYTKVFNGFAATMSARQARRVAADPDVAFVQPNVIHRISETQTNPPSYGLDRIDQRNRPLNQAYTYTTTAANVHAYIIDTGIRTTHQDFGGRATSGHDAVDGGTADDCNGHGTHVAGTVGGSAHGVAKGVQLVAVRVLNCEGSGTTAQVAAGIDWVTANAARGSSVANLSLGGGASTTLDAAVRRSISAGIPYAIAAGNSGVNAANTSPARVTEALTVGATSRTDARASWSNYGSVLDLFAPGVDITSAWRTSNTATYTGSGTSFSSPHVAGAAALYLAAHPGASVATVNAAIVAAATTGVVGNPGSGSPNRLLYTATLSS